MRSLSYLLSYVFFSMIWVGFPLLSQETTKLPISFKENWEVYPGDAFADQAFDPSKKDQWIHVDSIPLGEMKKKFQS